MATEGSTRESGYYWVKLGGKYFSDEWEIAEYRRGAIDRPWYVLDCIERFRDTELVEIGDRIPRPGEYTATDCVRETREHVLQVQNNLSLFVIELLGRIKHHDDSKFSPEELDTFTKVSPQLRSLTYGSDEYKASLAKMGEALKHHYAHNRHHPEYFPGGYRDMNLLDLVEMVCDWYAACKRHANGDINKSIAHNYERFNLSGDVATIFQNTVRDFFGVTLDKVEYPGDRATIEALQTKIVETTKQKDSIYCAERNALLVPLAKALIALGYDAGLGKHDPNDASWDEDWRNIVYIEFPSKLGGMDLPVQASWHIHDSELEMFSFLPTYKGTWDGHTTEEKYQRIREAEF
jgi:hypothetical protein